MIRILAFIFVLFTSINTVAQTSKSIDSKSKIKPVEQKKIDSDTTEVTVVKKGESKKDDGSTSKEKSRPVNIPKIDKEFPIVIDGRLDEKVWQNAALFKDFIQTSPGDNIAPSKKTEAYMMYDEKHLYIAFKCWDDRDKIRATVAKRDSVFGEDNVRVWLDTFNDQRRAYVLGWNPLGIQADGIVTEGGGTDFSVDIVMESKGMIHDWGWSVEVKIPFKSLRYQSGKGKLWGFNAARNIDRLNDEFDSWMPLDRNVSGFLIKHGKITGLDDIKSERTLEIVPTVTFSENGRRVAANEVPGGRFVNEPIKQEYGVTLKYTITPTVTLDVAINPDFAEIEADAPVVRANQRFPIFFREKRPFFLEGVDIFQSPIRIFHSRTIVDPDYAAKVSGKIGKNSFGFLVASDNAPGNFDSDSRIDPNRRPFIDEFVDKNAFFSVLRLKRDIGKENNLGFFSTARIFPERRNFVGGFDGRFKLNPKTVVNFQVLGSHTRRCFFDSKFDDILNPNQSQRNGEICGGGIVNGQQELGNIYSRYRTGNSVAYSANYDYSTDTFGYRFGGGGQSRDYRSDVGFNRRTNTNSLFFSTRKSTKSRPKANIIRFNWSGNVNARYDWKGRLQSANINNNVFFNFRRNTVLNLWTGMERETLFEEEFGLARLANRDGAFLGEARRTAYQPYAGGFFRTQPSKKFSISANGNLAWNSFDFDFGAGTRFPRVSLAALADSGAALDPGQGKRFNFNTNINLAPTDPLRISLSFNKSKLVRNDSGLTAFDSNIFSLRSTYQFTRFVFVRARIDYNTLRSNVSGQYLFGWTPSPGKAFFVGYNDNSNYNGFNPFTGDLEPKFQRNSRTFFIRMSYLFRKSF